MNFEVALLATATWLLARHRLGTIKNRTHWILAVAIVGLAVELLVLHWVLPDGIQ